jgi:hypothetical protein
MYHVYQALAPKRNSIKVLIFIIALFVSITAANPFNLDSWARERRVTSRNSCCNFLEQRAIAIEMRRSSSSSFNRANCCGFLENQARRYDNRRRNGRYVCGIGSFFSDLMRRIF